MATILKMLRYQTQLQFDLRHEKIAQIMSEKVFVMVMTSEGGLNVGPLYSFTNEMIIFSW